MKKVLLVLVAVLVFNSVNAQWYSKLRKSDFSSDYKIAYALGSGNDYPYIDVSLFIRNRDSELEVFVSGFGYFSSYSSKDHDLKLSIDGGEVYTAKNLSVSTDNEALFLGDFISDSGEVVSIEFILNLMKEGSRMSIRTYNGSDYNTAKFTLSGSSKSIDFVLKN